MTQKSYHTNQNKFEEQVAPKLKTYLYRQIYYALEPQLNAQLCVEFYRNIQEHLSNQISGRYGRTLIGNKFFEVVDEN